MTTFQKDVSQVLEKDICGCEDVISRQQEIKIRILTHGRSPVHFSSEIWSLWKKAYSAFGKIYIFFVVLIVQIFPLLG